MQAKNKRENFRAVFWFLKMIKATSDTRNKNRSAGMSLIEMVTALFIMTFIAAAMTELCVSHNVVAFRTFGKLDALTKARRVMAMMDQDVRTASFFPNNFVPTANIPAANSVADWPPPLPGYAADSQTIILQIPKFESNFPTGEQKIIVYKILPDKREIGKGQFVLQKKDFSNNSEPQTLLTGIVGPINPSNNVDPVALTPKPEVFSRISRTAPLYSSTGISSFQFPSLTKGIACNFEVHDAASGRKDLLPKSIAFRREIYARGNYAVSP